MKSKIILRTLIAFSFALFSLPFLETCSRKVVYDVEVVAVDSVQVDKTGNDSAKVSTQSFQNPEIEDLGITNETKTSSAESFYGLLIKTLGEGIDFETFKDKSSYSIFGYLLVLILTVVMLIVSFLNKIKTIQILSLINFVLLMSSTILLYFCDVIRSMNQIKIGFYLIIINFILIYIISTKIQKSNQLI